MKLIDQPWEPLYLHGTFPNGEHYYFFNRDTYLHFVWKWYPKTLEIKVSLYEPTKIIPERTRKIKIPPAILCLLKIKYP